MRATDTDASNWDDVPEYIKDTFDKLGIPEAERQFLAGAGAQYDSEGVYHNIREDLATQAVIFVRVDQGLAERAELLRECLAALAPAGGYPGGVGPWMRVGGRIVPVSQRYEAMGAEAEERALARAVADSISAAVVADSLAAAVAADGANGIMAEPAVMGHPAQEFVVIDSVVSDEPVFSLVPRHWYDGDGIDR